MERWASRKSKWNSYKQKLQTPSRKTWCVFVHASLHMCREEKPTTCHWMVYCIYNVLNIFRVLLCPSSRAQDNMCVITAYSVWCVGCWLLEVRCRAAGYAFGMRDTVWQLYNETDFILNKIEVLSMKQCMPSMWPTFICNLATPQRPMLSMTGKTAPCCAGSERTWSQ